MSTKSQPQYAPNESIGRVMAAALGQMHAAVSESKAIALDVEAVKSDPMTAVFGRMGCRLVACRALGLPYPPDESDSARVNAKSELLLRYDQQCPDADWRRWTLNGHDTGDEDRSER